MKFRVFLIITASLSLALALGVGWQLHRLRQGSALCSAVRQGNTKQALALLREGADPNTREPLYPDSTPMQALRRLWNHWRSPQKTANQDYGASVLQLAVEKDAAAVVKDLLERGASDINAQLPFDDSDEVWHPELRPLVIVVTANKHPDLVWMFLKRGAAQSQEDRERLLCAAARADNMELVHYLLENGTNADGGAKWDEGNYPDRLPPIVHAVQNRNIGIATLLLEHHARTNFIYEGSLATLMTVAAGNGDNAIIKLLLAHGTHVDLRAKLGTPLCFAAYNGHLNVVKTLVAAGADVNYNGYGGSALTQAEGPDIPESKRLPILKLLLAKGAKVNDPVKGDWTALLSAASGGEAETVKLLLRYGADINHYDRECETALTLAVEENHLNVARLLLSRGAKIRLICYPDYGDTTRPTLIDAMKKVKTPAMKALLRRYDRR